MRKSFILLLAVLCALFLFGCVSEEPVVTTTPENPTIAPTEAPTEPVTEAPTEPTEPETTAPVLDTTKFYDIDVTGMTEAEAKEAIVERINNYSLTLTVNKKAITFSGGQAAKALNRNLPLRGIFCSTSWAEQSLVTLQRPLPVISSFLPRRSLRSSSSTLAPCWAAVMAANIPAGPPPIIIPS